MTHDPIFIQNIAFSLPQKVCFSQLSTQIPYGARIGVIGRNGSGKSILLKMLHGVREPSDGKIHIPDDVIFGYVPQVIEDFDALSGGQRLNKSLTQALSCNPNILLLDEPTNHLDRHNRKSLLRMLQKFPGTLIVVTHDVELLRTCIDTLWHIDEGKVHIFSGNYDDYAREVAVKRVSLEEEYASLDRQKKDAHQSLMKEQSRAKNSRLRGEKLIEQRKWPTVVSAAKVRRATETSGVKKRMVSHTKQDLNDRLSELRLPEMIKPKFALSASRSGSQILVSIQDAACGYEKPILQNISLSVGCQERIAISGDNGSGKSTLIKAILDDPLVMKSGHWFAPKPSDIGYLDQDYGALDPQKTVLETICELAPTWCHGDIRRHLNDFLFRKNEEINVKAHTLSGGEKVRLTLAKIAAKTPKLLILDEVTNNLDLETREHVIQVLKHYPGAMIVISHDEDFLKAIGVTDFYHCE
jgi:ATPase subunit of ABC transporter with duplicated ATPase domains